jgi:ABC-type multidrug transport system fused ATPase/permease subunit
MAKSPGARKELNGGTINGKDKKDLPKAKLSVENFRKSFKLFDYLKNEKWKFVIGMICLGFSAGVGLYFPMVAGKLLGVFGDDTTPKEILMERLQKVGLTLLVLLTAQGIFSFGRVYFFSLVTESILKGLRTDAFSKMVQMPMSFFSKNQTAELSSRIATDVNVIQEAFTVNIAEVIRQSIVGIGGFIIIIIKVDWAIAKWFVFIIPPIIVVAILYSRRIRKYSKNMQDKIAQSNVIVNEALMGISSVKSFTNEFFEISRYTKNTEDIRKFGIKFGVLRGIFFTFVMTVIFGAIFFILYKMTELKIEKVITPDEFGQFLMLSLFVAGSLGGLPGQIGSIQQALGATDRVFEIINGEHETIDLKQQTSPVKRFKGDIEFKNVQFTYPTRTDYEVLKKVSFKVDAGETMALVGSSGSGKSTIASLVLRFYEIGAGEYTIDGKKASDYDLTELREQMAIVPQDVLLFGGSIRENILYGKPTATEEEVVEAARKANALEFIDSFPDKFDTIVGDRGIQLSGGQRQRVAIARAVLKNPSILILDEATSSLDSESERLVQEALDKLMVGRTSIVIAHRLSTIKNADKIVVLHKGEVTEAGTHKELIKNEEGLYYRLSKMQFDSVSSLA